LSLWECDRLIPTAPYHACIIAYLGYNPFQEATRIVPETAEGNESQNVAFL